MNALQFSCVACEDRPRPPNDPCAVCGKSASVIAWASVPKDDLSCGFFTDRRDEAEAVTGPGSRVVRVKIELVEKKPTVRCNRCGGSYDEDDLIATIDSADGEPSRACPICKTDNYLTDEESS